jgi:adenosylmethionine-8-amino-7-oxononanoate aminotransferase
MVSSPGVLKPGQTRPDRAAEVLDEMRTLLTREGDRVCAIVVEPLVQAAGGILTHDPAFLRGVRELCDQTGAAMLVDEVATGVGATGRWFAVEHAGVSPDLLVVGKRVTGGVLPLSAVLVRDAVYEAFLGDAASGRTFFHGHTYTANPLACAAAIANLRLVEERDTVRHAALVGERIGVLLRMLDGAPGVVEVRRIGTMTGIEIGPFAANLRAGMRVCREARRRGVLIRPLGDVVVLMPPLAIPLGGPENELDRLVTVTVDCIRDVLSELA